MLVHIVLVVVTEVMTSTTSQKALIASGSRVGSSIAIQVRHARRRLVVNSEQSKSKGISKR